MLLSIIRPLDTLWLIIPFMCATGVLGVATGSPIPNLEGAGIGMALHYVPTTLASAAPDIQAIGSVLELLWLTLYLVDLGAALLIKKYRLDGEVPSFINVYQRIRNAFKAKGELASGQTTQG